MQTVVVSTPSATWQVSGTARGLSLRELLGDGGQMTKGRPSLYLVVIKLLSLDIFIGMLTFLEKVSMVGALVTDSH